MAPSNGKQPAICGTKRPHDDSDGNTSGEAHVDADRIELECIFQVETLRQAATNSISAPEGMNSVYIVYPTAIWDSMSRFKNFSVNDEHFAVHDDVYINRFFTHFNQARRVERVEEEWAARVLEIRGFDQAHVYLRVMWFYIPEDLPRGREDYHGSEELIASNDMSIVDASNVTGRADIPKWIENDEDGPPKHPAPFWRQTYDKMTGNLSQLPTYCICLEPQNPDEPPLIRCTDPECSVRMHQHCIESDLYVREFHGSEPNSPTFKVEVINVKDPHNYHDDVEPPRLEFTDLSSTPPHVWEQEIVCLQCEEPLA